METGKHSIWGRNSPEQVQCAVWAQEDSYRMNMPVTQMKVAAVSWFPLRKLSTGSLQDMAKKLKSLFAERGDGDRGKPLCLHHFIPRLSLLSSELQRLISFFLLMSHLWMHKKLQHSSLSDCLADQVHCCMSWLLYKVSHAACLWAGLIICPTYL